MAFGDFGVEGRVTLDKNGLPVFVKPITNDDLRGFNTTDPEDVALLNRALIQDGTVTPSDIRKSASKYLERWNYEPGTDDYDRAFEKLISDAGSKKVLLGTARRAAEKAELFTLTRGNVNQTVVRVPEGPDPCPACLELIGVEGTVAELSAKNQLPGDQCYGGDYCMCILVPIN